ncbi:nickel pincer cofactor-dependent isomerase, group 22 [Desulfotruncus alcoholivorax]|uniref:lactate racemase domain-containing protein n=1 Tax=Desulfotruncus alcoholivorax TaxID=265477 RepID=UPI00041A8A87|nr:lactate racemase domain-containing protein [Desulfotruncus alcoholivorax]
MFPMYLIKQSYDCQMITNIEEHVRGELERIGAREKVFPGMNLCLPYGSRGFPYGLRVIQTLAEIFKSWGAEPFIVPAMGSHGGGNDKGQAEVLEKMGITEQVLKVPIKSCAQGVYLGRTSQGVPVYCDKYALEADGVFLFNRVKPHTAFRAPIESGLTKMLTVGLGKPEGAQAAHRAGLGRHIVEMAEIVERNIKLIGGIAAVDNFRGDALILKGVRPKERQKADMELLQTAWCHLPRLPFEHLHVLVIDQMGKNISGTGMDINVIGLHRRFGGNPDKNYQTIVVLELTSETKGNAHGIGYADITTRQLVDRIDWQTMYKNAITTGILSSVKIPCTLPSEREAIETACRIYGLNGCRVARIKDTKHLEYFWVSEPLLNELEDIEIIKKVDDIFKTVSYS